MFTELSSAQTGIVTTNRYDDPRMWGELNREYEVGHFGTGVAIGDYDGDGQTDVFIVSKVESGRLFRNRGNWQFEDVTKAAGVEDSSRVWKQGAAFADVDNDGRLDLYVCRFGAPNQLYMNQGNGTFREEAAARGLAVSDASNMACFADYDRDGWLDVYLQTNLRNASTAPEGQRDFLFRNNGDGSFRDVTGPSGILPKPTQGHSATWWDFDEDGWPDLYVANDFGAPDFLYRNNGDGTFSEQADRVLPHMPFSSMGSDLGDIDNDGHIDFFVADMAGTTREKHQRGTANQTMKGDPHRNEYADHSLQGLYNALYLNTGTGRCLEAAQLAGVAATDWTWSTRFEDLDNDGRLDLHITNGMERDQINLDLVNKRLSALSAIERINIMKNSPLLQESNLVYANRGGLRFEEVGSAWGLGQAGVSLGSAFGDFDNDGDLDLIYSNFQQGATILRNDSQQGNRVMFQLQGTHSNRFGVGARITLTTRAGLQVRELVLARGYLSTSEPVLHFGLGEHAEIERLKVSWPSGREQVWEHLPAGRRYILTEPATGGAVAARPPVPPVRQFEDVSVPQGIDLVQREERLEGTVPQPWLPRRFNRRGPGLAVGDVNGDLVDEIVVGATALDAAKLLLRSETAYSSHEIAVQPAGTRINDGPPLVFDANGDGWNDLLFTGGGAALPAEEPEYQPRLWLNDGNGSYGLAPTDALPQLPICAGVVVAADFDRDGKLDLFVGARLLPGYFPESPRSALLLQDNGRLTDRTAGFALGLETVGHVTSALASDVDQDGWVDLVVTLEWGGVRFFRNGEGKRLSDASVEFGFDHAGTGLWTSVAAGDFNSDGRMDFALGNLGLNTDLRATRESPLRLLSGDFAGRGTPQLVLAEESQGRKTPVVSRTELAVSLPLVLKRFPSNNRYAAATLEEILGDEAVRRATVLSAGELQSGVLLSQPAGGYRFQALPRAAQISPIQGLVARDFDGDGRCDLLCVTNDYSPTPTLGRWDGGLGWWLRGDGQGGWEPIPAERSGWIVPGNAKALVVADLDGDYWPDAIVSRNNQTTQAFRNAGNAGRRPIAVRLVGRGGNPGAIGARVTLECDGRILQSTEVQAGGGYMSQSTATCFFSVDPTQSGHTELKVFWPSGKATNSPLPPAGGFVKLTE